jgi:hypothetical protein
VEPQNGHIGFCTFVLAALLFCVPRVKRVEVVEGIQLQRIHFNGVGSPEPEEIAI